jgi:hypothetical protein
MSRVKSVILFRNSTTGEPQLRAVNRSETKYYWIDGTFIKKDLPHYRVEPDRSDPILRTEPQNSDSFEDSHSDSSESGFDFAFGN